MIHGVEHQSNNVIWDRTLTAEAQGRKFGFTNISFNHKFYNLLEAKEKKKFCQVVVSYLCGVTLQNQDKTKS